MPRGESLLFTDFTAVEQRKVFDLPQPGVLDAAGETTGTLTIADIPILIGLELRFQVLVTDAATGAPLAISPAQRVVMLPAF